MRSRLIRPSYWSDSDLHLRLTADVREFYIGLWMAADDAGYVPWDVDRLAAELYPYRTHDVRVAQLQEWLVLLGPEHASLLQCGRHVLIPNLERHQTTPRPTYTNRKAHAECRPQRLARASTDEHVQVREEQTQRKGGSKGSEVNRGAAALDLEENGETEFQRLVPRPIALGGGRAS